MKLGKKGAFIVAELGIGDWPVVGAKEEEQRPSPPPEA